MSMVLLDGMGRSGTSLLARLMASILEPGGYVYYYEPFHHPTPAGELQNWQEMIVRVLRPDDQDVELKSYIEQMEAVSGGLLFWKEIRLALKQDWLLRQFPNLKIVHITRDIMGVLSSHRRESAPEWMQEHRRIWRKAVTGWAEQESALRSKGIELPDAIHQVEYLDEFAQHALVWVLNESMIRIIESPRLFRLKYESLCADPRESLDRLAKFLGQEINDDRMADLLKQMAATNPGIDPSGAWHGLSSEEMPSIWRQRLDRQTIAVIEAVAGATRKSLGYDPVI